MTLQDLKNSILQLAIQGKLVEQRPEEGSAEDLYAQIQAEKQALIKAKKIKKEKPLPEITDEEKPFDIPNSWKWVRLGNTITLLSGQDLTPTQYNASGKGIPYITGASNIEDGNLVINRWTENGKNFSYAGDLLITCKGTVGKLLVLKEPQVHIARQLMSMHVYSIDVQFLLYFVECNIQILKTQAKSMIPGIERKNVLQLNLPLPPLAEQKRIVEKIEQLLPLIDRYGEAWNQLETFNTRFPDDMQKAILQAAIQGKLVEQRTEEGSAEELYAQIQAEKKKLIKEKKIKKDKPLPEITDEEKPFDIPDNWKWVRFGNVMINRDSERVPLSVFERSKLSKIYDYYGASGVIDKVDDYLFDKTLLLIGEDGANLLTRSTPIAYLATGKYWVNNHAQVKSKFVCNALFQ